MTTEPVTTCDYIWASSKSCFRFWRGIIEHSLQLTFDGTASVSWALAHTYAHIFYTGIELHIIRKHFFVLFYPETTHFPFYVIFFCLFPTDASWHNVNLFHIPWKLGKFSFQQLWSGKCRLGKFNLTFICYLSTRAAKGGGEKLPIKIVSPSDNPQNIPSN